MTPETFVSRVRSTAMHQTAATYKDLFGSTLPKDASDPYWKRALTLYQSLNDADRAVLLEIMQQVAVDTVSGLFAILDGVDGIDGPQEDFVLTSQSDNRKLNGNLQDLFLEAQEREQQRPGSGGGP